MRVLLLVAGELRAAVRDGLLELPRNRGAAALEVLHEAAERAVHGQRGQVRRQPVGERRAREVAHEGTDGEQRGQRGVDIARVAEVLEAATAARGRRLLQPLQGARAAAAAAARARGRRVQQLLTDQRRGLVLVVRGCLLASRLARQRPAGRRLVRRGGVRRGGCGSGGGGELVGRGPLGLVRSHGGIEHPAAARAAVLEPTPAGSPAQNGEPGDMPLGAGGGQAAATPAAARAAARALAQVAAGSEAASKAGSRLLWRRHAVDRCQNGLRRRRGGVQTTTAESAFEP